jgi:hypothetical protein
MTGGAYQSPTVAAMLGGARAEGQRAMNFEVRTDSLAESATARELVARVHGSEEERSP